jgi:hypothetical protein
MSKLDFFGLGNSSAEEDRTNFRLKDGLLGLFVEQRFSDWLVLTARAEALRPEIRRGRSSTLPSIETQFSDADAPGLTQQPNFTRYEAAVRLELPAGDFDAVNQGGDVRAAHSYYSDGGLDRYSFRRWDIEGRQRFTVLGPLRRLTLHGQLSTTMTSAGHDVPFYFMPTLGGLPLPEGPIEHAIGSDGTLATLRGFTNYRFRDRNVLLLQAEYRQPLWGPIDFSVFGDLGKVASARADLDLSDLRHDFGAGLSIMRGSSTATRLDIAFGGEGTRVVFTIGRVIAP